MKESSSEITPTFSLHRKLSHVSDPPPPSPHLSYCLHLIVYIIFITNIAYSEVYVHLHVFHHIFYFLLQLFISYIHALRYVTLLAQCASCGRVCNGILRNGLNLTRDWTWGSVHLSPIVQVLNKWAWPELYLLCLLHVPLVKTNEREEAFFWPIAVSDLCCRYIVENETD